MTSIQAWLQRPDAPPAEQRALHLSNALTVAHGPTCILGGAALAVAGAPVAGAVIAGCALVFAVSPAVQRAHASGHFYAAAAQIAVFTAIACALGPASQAPVLLFGAALFPLVALPPSAHGLRGGFIAAAGLAGVLLMGLPSAVLPFTPPVDPAAAQWFATVAVPAAMLQVVAIAWLLADAAQGSDAEIARLRDRADVVHQDSARASEVVREAQAVAEASADAQRFAHEDRIEAMTRELRRPMHSMLGTATLLERAATSDEQRELVGILQRSSASLQGLVDELTNWSGPAELQVDLAAESFDLIALLEETTELFAPRAADRGLRLTTTISPEVPREVVGDTLRVRQILVNQLANAVGFTNSGRVDLTADACFEDGTATITFSVSDTGPGIAPHEIEALFGPPEAGSSRGVGLALCRRLARAMEGDVEATSTVGIGSTFVTTLRLPAWRMPRKVLPDALAGTAFRLLGPTAGPLGSVGAALRREGYMDMDIEGCASPTPLLFLAWPLDDASRAALGDLRWRSRGRACLVAHQIDTADLSAAASRMGTSFLCLPARLDDITGHVLQMLGEAQVDGADEAVDDVTEEVVVAERRVLLVEDDRVNQMVGSRLLQMLGHPCDIAPDGATCLQMARERQYDVILMDCEMPVMNGLEATRALRAREDEHRPVIIALTANALAEERQECLDAGMDDHLSKPLRGDALAKLLDAYLAAAVG